MATKAAFGGPSPHTSGIFADMTVDGPEIGTLVIIVDRAKNLPNRKTMGKQNPYCAARLGKEARKTDTDRRGGQTPRWDQELRFTVHDSPDYHTLKISIFSEDKRTDLIGEAWVSLKEVLVPGGAKSDLWQGLNCKGKYAGELRIELTYYDERPKPEPSTESIAGSDSFGSNAGEGSGRVKRRPLPSNPNSRHVTPDTIAPPAAPGRAKHGPRDLRMPPRANTMPPEAMNFSQHQVEQLTHHRHEQQYGSWPPRPVDQTPPHEIQDEYEQYHEPQGYDSGMYDEAYQPNFLPELPPSNRQRGPMPPQQHFAQRHGQPLPRPRPQSHVGLPHSQSAPIVPTTHAVPQAYDDSYQLSTDYPEAIPDLEYQHQQLAMRPRRSYEEANRQAPYVNQHANQQPFVEEDDHAPPPPPVHSNSAPVVPHYGQNRQHASSVPTLPQIGTQPHARHNSVPNSSPLQNIERRYGASERTPPRVNYNGVPNGAYSSPAEQQLYNSSPSGFPPGQTPSPHARPPPAARPMPQTRHSVAEPYTTTAPPRPHPLSQEVPRSRSPQPHIPLGFPGSSPHNISNSPYPQIHRDRDSVPLHRPHPVSPQTSEPPTQPNSADRSKSSYGIQFPIRAFESADSSPLSNSQPRPQRKSISTQPSPTVSTGGTPFSPDSFDVHNPNARPSTLSNGNSPHSPYQIRPGSNAPLRDDPNGPILNWHGQEIDPSDRLPVDAWAPEPEVKTPIKTYGLGRNRDFGPRSAQSSSPGGAQNLSRDTVVNVRMKAAPPIQTQPEPDTSPSRNRLQKKIGAFKSSVTSPMQERHSYDSASVPNPYEQQQLRSGFHDDRSPGGNNVYGHNVYDRPPNPDALSREISSIDIGSGRHTRAGSVPAPVAYQPVRSHRDRNSFY